MLEIEFIEKRLTYPEKGFYKRIKRSGIQIAIKKKKKPREISIMMEDRLLRTLCYKLYCQKRSL